MFSNHPNILKCYGFFADNESYICDKLDFILCWNMQLMLVCSNLKKNHYFQNLMSL